MALQAKRIYIGHVEQARIGGAMGRVADGTALGFDHWMFVNEGAHRVRVALHTDSVLISRRPKLLGLKCAMRIMTVAARHQSFIHFVMKRLRE
jgi:hypothetical protein